MVNQCEPSSEASFQVPKFVSIPQSHHEKHLEMSQNKDHPKKKSLHSHSNLLFNDFGNYLRRLHFVAMMFAKQTCRKDLSVQMSAQIHIPKKNIKDLEILYIHD